MNNLINQQRERIAELEAQLVEVTNGATGQAPCSKHCEARAVEIEMRGLRAENARLRQQTREMNQGLLEVNNRAEAAEQRVKELERLLRYAEEQQLLPQMSFEGARELVSEIQKDATDAGGCYEVSTNLLDQLFERYTDRGACVLLNKFAIEQQIKGVKLMCDFTEHELGGDFNSVAVKLINRLRAKLGCE